MKKTAGYLLLALSCLAWAAVFAMPLVDLSLEKAATLTAGLVIAGEVAFLLGIAILGKEAWEKIKAFFRKRKS